jgi:hypothetical protein
MHMFDLAIVARRLRDTSKTWPHYKREIENLPAGQDRPDRIDLSRETPVDSEGTPRTWIPKRSPLKSDAELNRKLDVIIRSIEVRAL